MTALSRAALSQFLILPPHRSGRGIDPRQSRDARQLCRHPLGGRRDPPRHCRGAVVAVGRGRVVVFLFVGRPLLDRVGPAGAAMIAAGAGIVRWAVMAETASLPALAAIEPLHGLTFALFAPDLHAVVGRMCSAAPGGDSVDGLRHSRYRRCNDAADARLGSALRPLRSTRVLDDGGSLRRGVAPCSDAARACEPNVKPSRTNPR
jgi:hypothetical protein